MAGEGPDRNSVALICCSGAASLEAGLAHTLVWRREFDRRFAVRLETAQALALEAPEIVLVERDLDWALPFVTWIRRHPSARLLSVAILARGDVDPVELELLEKGANAVLRLPATAEWDRRLAGLTQIGVRKAVRVPVTFQVEIGLSGETHAATSVNLSEIGMLVESSWLDAGDDVHFAFRLPGRPGLVSGCGRVVRQVVPKRFGIEFTDLSGECLELMRSFLESL
jgi:hypothetical protein